MNTKNNMILAEFLGWESKKTYFSDSEGENTRYGLKFDTDWNWLMLVVEKIETDSRVYEVVTKRCNTSDKYYCEILFNFKSYRGVYTEGNDKITTVFNACVEVIKELY